MTTPTCTTTSTSPQLAPDPRSPAERTLNTIELLEQVLLHLPEKDLLVNAQRVNQQFKATIDGSFILQEKLCFRQTNKEVPFDETEWINPLFTGNKNILTRAIWYARKKGAPSLAPVDGEWVDDWGMDDRNAVLEGIDTQTNVDEGVEQPSIVLTYTPRQCRRHKWYKTFTVPPEGSWQRMFLSRYRFIEVLAEVDLGNQGHSWLCNEEMELGLLFMCEEDDAGREDYFNFGGQFSF